MTSLPLAERCYRALLYRYPTSTAAAEASAATAAQLDKALFLSAHRPQVGGGEAGAGGGWMKMRAQAQVQEQVCGMPLL